MVKSRLKKSARLSAGCNCYLGNAHIEVAPSLKGASLSFEKIETVLSCRVICPWDNIWKSSVF